MPINNDDIDALRTAVQLLEHPSLAARLTNMVESLLNYWAGRYQRVLRRQ